jgi:small subunit ribosomal protein S16
MAATIRLSRNGAKKRPYYRIIVTDSRAPRDGRRLEQVGTYDPNQNPARVQFQQEKLEHWLRRGARPSLTVAQLMKRSGIACTTGTRAAAAPPGETPT